MSEPGAYEAYLEVMRETGVPVKEVTLPDISNLIRERVVTPLVQLLSNVIKDVREIHRLILEGRMEDALLKLTPYVVGSLGVSLTFDLLQTKVMGTGIDIRKTVDKIDRLINWELIASTVVGVMVGTGVETPAKYYFNALFTPSIPDTRTLVIGYIKGYFTEETLRRYLRFHGIHDSFHKLVIDLNDFTPSISLIQRLYRVYPPRDDVLEDWLRENGVLPEEIPYYKEWFRREILRDEFSKLETVVKDLYVSGYLSDSELEVILNEIKAHPEEIQYAKRTLRRLKLKNLLKMYEEKQIHLFRKGRISPQELYERLARIYADKEIAQAKVAIECARIGIEYPPEAGE